MLLLCSWWCWPGLSLSHDFHGHIPQGGQAAPTARWHLDPAQVDPDLDPDRVEVGAWKFTTLRRKGAELAGGCCALVLTPGGNPCTGGALHPPECWGEGEYQEEVQEPADNYSFRLCRQQSANTRKDTLQP